ncbi:MAG: ABC transporter permease [Candidatus Cryptobacteroides sp.]|jgi:ABC-2 type transport system permease protein|nr:ABC transporter permease [Bacteroides sp.]MCI7663342.1 ABC transporter permease [Bacteroides sp.]MDD6624919.1 ABC transporter permease [Bacteroides sp.]MDY5302174.1 ABC transporter permease [Candidatus Cryptobacteroides sp.]MDY5406740.1 ABC transporter permease [Candidatus Cryptobacteroides sp.]
MNFWQNIGAVVRRELRIMRNRPIYLLGSVVTVAFCAIFFLTFLKQGLPHDLPIGIVDLDNSSLSRNFSRQLDATQLGKVLKYDSFAEAREDMQSGKITAVCVIPAGMYADVQASRRPTFTYYLNGLYFVGGALSYKNILTMINLADGAVQREVLRAKGVNEDAIMGRIQPVNVDVHQIGNQYTNYGYYLTNIFLPGVLALTVVIILIYSLGAELKYGTSRHLLSTAGGSMYNALFGKLVVYTTLFSVIGLILILLMYDWMHFPINGSIWNMFLAIVLLVLASESVAIFIIGLLPIPRLALSIGALYSVLAFSMSGFTLPVETMPPYIQGLAEAFPLRHYFLFYSREVIFGTGFAGWWQEVIHLLIFLLLPSLVIYRLKGAYVRQNFPKK